MKTCFPWFETLLGRLGLQRPELRAWAMYDWANSAFVLIIVTAVFPIFYKSVPAGELSDETATAYFGWATTIVLALVALISPVLGAMADFLAWRKKLLAVSTAIGVISAGLMIFPGRGDWWSALILFSLGNLGLSASFVFYDSLLPHIASKEEMDRVSSAGYALGYCGSGLLLILCLLWIQFPQSWGFDDSEAATRFSFFSVALWWLLFSLPVFKSLREPPRQLEQGEQGASDAVRTAFRRLSTTFSDFRVSHRQTFILLIGILIYSDGIGTIIRMAAIYATTRGLPDSDIISAILLVQFIGIPFSFLFGNLAEMLGTKNTILVGLVVYGLTTVVAFGMDTVEEFYLLAILVGTVQGGTQALSRSFFARLIPRHRTSEFFGFFSFSDKVAGIAGPLVFSSLLTLTGSNQIAILSILIFFIAGGAILFFVDEAEGIREVEAAERRILDANRQ